jgi:hypothetical protein
MAREAIVAARTVEQLRQAQSVVLPLDCGLSLQQTAQIPGVSPGWACQLRRRFMQGQIAGAADAPGPGGRKRQNMTVEQERELLAPFLEQAAFGGVLLVDQIKRRWTNTLTARLHWPGPTTCYTATAGGR